MRRVLYVVAVLGLVVALTPRSRAQDVQIGAYIGQIKLFACDYVPAGFLPCDGRTVDAKGWRMDGLAYYVGNTYGGDGVQTIKLPDLREAEAALNKGRNGKGLRYGICYIGEGYNLP